MLLTIEIYLSVTYLGLIVNLSHIELGLSSEVSTFAHCSECQIGIARSSKAISPNWIHMLKAAKYNSTYTSINLYSCHYTYIIPGSSHS